MAVRSLLRAGLLDGTRRILSGELVLIPVKDDASLPELARRLDARVVDGAHLAAREGRRAPVEEVRALLPFLDAALVPDKWEQHDDVLVLRLPPALMPHARDVGAAFAEALGLKCVLHDPEGVRGELREMRAEVIWGADPVAVHVENGVRYRFDASRIMFSSGNLAERMRVAQLPARGETVVDMFAGIGYFTLPLAVHARAARIHAIEKNPVSFRFLQENVALNRVEDSVVPWCGDNREFPLEAIADRVMMGYFPDTHAFLTKALALVKREGGIVHYHDTAHAESWRDELWGHVQAAARGAARTVTLESARVVKSHSPGVVHAVLDVRVRSA